MLHKAIFFAASLMLISTQVAAGQAQAWLRATAGFRINTKWQTDAELQLRRQSGQPSGHPLPQPLLYSGRLWMYYRPAKNLELGIAPMAFFRHCKPGNNPDHQAPRHEYRASVSAAMQRGLSGSLNANARTMLEYRLTEREPSAFRLRNRAGLAYQLGDALTASLSYELLLQSSGTDLRPQFDHDRLSAGIRYHSGTYYIEAGLMQLHRIPPWRFSSLSGEHTIYLSIGVLIRKGERHC